MNVPVKRNASIGAYRKQYEQQRKQKIKKNSGCRLCLCGLVTACGFFL